MQGPRGGGSSSLILKFVFWGAFATIAFTGVYLSSKSFFNLSPDQPTIQTEEMFYAAADKRVEDTLKTLDNVDIGDNNLRACIAETAKLYAEGNGVTDITQLPRLSCEGREINYIDGISALSGLEFIDLSYNNISDIYELHKLQSVKTMWLTNNPISTVSALQEMPNLESVKLPDMPDFYCYELLQATQNIQHNIKNIECKGKYGLDINSMITRLNRGEELSIEEQERLENYRYNEQMMTDLSLVF